MEIYTAKVQLDKTPIDSNKVISIFSRINKGLRMAQHIKNKPVKYVVQKTKKVVKNFDKKWIIEHYFEVLEYVKKYEPYAIYDNYDENNTDLQNLKQLSLNEFYSKYLTLKQKNTRVYEIVSDFYNYKNRTVRPVELDDF